MNPNPLPNSNHTAPHAQVHDDQALNTGLLRRDVGLGGAILMGLGSIVGTGVFVGVGLATAATGPAVVLAIGVAGMVAICNGLSSARLAARFPVSGGTYEYASRVLHPTLGFVAGWMFLCAKTASAATAALGFTAAVTLALGWDAFLSRILTGLGLIALPTLATLNGIRRSNGWNAIIVSLTLGVLVSFVLAGSPTLWRAGLTPWRPFVAPMELLSPEIGFLKACALIFVAFTGYGRIATLTEEVRDPARTIPGP